MAHLFLGHFDQGWSQGLFWEIITGRVEFGFGNCNGFDDVVINNHGEPLATVDNSNRLGTIGSELHVAGSGKFTEGVREHFDNRSLSALIRRPGVHDRRIINTKNDNLFDSRFFECVFRFQVSWNLTVGSGRRKSSWKTNNCDLLARSVHGHVTFFIRAEIEEHINSRDLASGLHGGKSIHGSNACRQSG